MKIKQKEQDGKEILANSVQLLNNIFPSSHITKQLHKHFLATT